jgi:hypothetical protein
MLIRDDMDPQCTLSVHDSFDIFQSGYGNSYLKQWYIIILMLDFLQLPDRCAPCFQHTHILHSISVVTSSSLILWGKFFYTLFWSSNWSIDKHGFMFPKYPIFMRKVTVFLFQNSLLRRVVASCIINKVWWCLVIVGCPKSGLWCLCRLFYMWGATMPKGIIKGRTSRKLYKGIF